MTKHSTTAKNDRAKPHQARSKSQSNGATPSQSGDTSNGPAPLVHENLPPPANLTAPKQPSKLDGIAAMLVRDEGATLDAMVEASGWLKHTARAALTGLKKKGYALSSDKVDGVRTYRAVAPE